jgi:hypothetical protein
MNHPFFQTPTSDAPYYPHQRPERLHDGATIVTREVCTDGLSIATTHRSTAQEITALQKSKEENCL